MACYVGDPRSGSHRAGSRPSNATEWRAADAFVSTTGQPSLRNDAANTDDHDGDEFSGGDRGDEPEGVSAGVPTGGVRVAGAA